MNTTLKDSFGRTKPIYFKRKLFEIIPDLFLKVLSWMMAIIPLTFHLHIIIFPSSCPYVTPPTS